MHSLEGDLYLSHAITPETQERLDAWSAALAQEAPHEPTRWHVHFHRYMRSVTVAASTAIEGNPMSAPQVDALLSGETVMAPMHAQQENLNYNRALDLATTFALTPTFLWTETIPRAINSTLLHSLPDDRLGRYRDGPVIVGGTYQAPSEHVVDRLMGTFIEWLRDCDEHPLVRVALLHLNLVAIHPFFDGNGRTARILSTLALMRAGVQAPELLTVETYLAARRVEYFQRLSDALGESYQPDRHSATEWIDYYVNVSTGLLDIETRLDEAFPIDLGVIAATLDRLGQPPGWATVLHMAATYPVRSRDIAEVYERSLPWARGLLNQLVTAGWLHQEGRTRASRWLPTPQLMRLDLRFPVLISQFESGQTLGLDVA
ncbi:MAG: Fic family protein [Chloroflexota bacterium]